MLCSDSVRSFVRKLVFVWLLWNLRIEKGSKDWNLMCYVPFCLFICHVLFWFLENENSSGLRIIFLCNWLDEAVFFFFFLVGFTRCQIAEVCVSKINRFHSFGLTSKWNIKF